MPFPLSAFEKEWEHLSSLSVLFIILHKCIAKFLFLIINSLDSLFNCASSHSFHYFHHLAQNTSIPHLVENCIEIKF